MRETTESLYHQVLASEGKQLNYALHASLVSACLTRMDHNRSEHASLRITSHCFVRSILWYIGTRNIRLIVYLRQIEQVPVFIEVQSLCCTDGLFPRFAQRETIAQKCEAIRRSLRHAPDIEVFPSRSLDGFHEVETRARIDRDNWSIDRASFVPTSTALEAFLVNAQCYEKKVRRRHEDREDCLPLSKLSDPEIAERAHCTLLSHLLALQTTGTVLSEAC